MQLGWTPEDRLHIQTLKRVGVLGPMSYEHAKQLKEEYDEEPVAEGLSWTTKIVPLFPPHPAIGAETSAKTSHSEISS